MYVIAITRVVIIVGISLANDDYRHCQLALLIAESIQQISDTLIIALRTSCTPKLQCFGQNSNF